MRPNRVRLRAIAAWLGVLALSLDALAPIHLAFGLAINLANSRECGHHEGDAPVRDGLGWWALVLLTGHDESADPSQSHNGFHPTIRPACAAIGTPAGAVPATAATLPHSLRLEDAGNSPVLAETQPHSTPRSGYRSRAPPIASTDLII
jgi:hypothetical protein